MDRSAWILSIWLSRTLNPLTTSQVRAVAFGSDALGETATDAAEWPVWLGKGFPPLPEPLGPALQADSDAAIGVAAPKFRNALRQFASATGKEQKADMLSEYLTWKELIHTSYFESRLFCKLVAFALLQVPGFRASPAFKSDPDYERVATMYLAISGKPQARN